MILIEISKVTKIAVLVTTVGILVAYKFFPGPAFFAVSIIVLTLLAILYPGTEKIGIVGMAEYLQAAFVTTIITVIAFVVTI